MSDTESKNQEVVVSNSSAPKQDTTAETKPPYRSPKISTLGTVEELTKVKGGTKQDGGTLPRSRSTGTPG